MEVVLSPIGIIHTSIESKEDAPVQGAFCPKTKGELEIFPQYHDGLKDIELFSHIILLYHFHQAGEVEMVRQTFLDDTPHGVFASRHPCRPNGIGITTVKLAGRDGNTLYVEGIDVLDGTPLIDIKPYVPRFDSFPNASEGWLKNRPNRQKPQGRE